MPKFCLQKESKQMRDPCHDIEDKCEAFLCHVAKVQNLLKKVALLYVCLQFLEHKIIAVTNMLLLARVNYPHVGLSSPSIDTSSPWLNELITN